MEDQGQDSGRRGATYVHPKVNVAAADVGEIKSITIFTFELMYKIETISRMDRLLNLNRYVKVLKLHKFPLQVLLELTKFEIQSHPIKTIYREITLTYKQILWLSILLRI